MSIPDRIFKIKISPFFFERDSKGILIGDTGRCIHDATFVVNVAGFGFQEMPILGNFPALGL